MNVRRRLAVVSVLAVCSIGSGAGLYSKRIPIGSFWDGSSPYARAAFQYELSKHNNSTSSTNFKLERYFRSTKHAGAFQLARTVCETMQTGMFAFFGDVNASTQSVVLSISAKFHIPFLTASAPSARADAPTAYMLYLRPRYEQAIVDLIEHFRWDSAWYLYDSPHTLPRIERLFRTLVKRLPNINVNVVKLKNVDDSYDVLKVIDRQQEEGVSEAVVAPDDGGGGGGGGVKHRKRKKSVEHRIVLDISTEAGLRSILRQIRNLGMNRHHYHYIIGGLSVDELELDDFRHGGVNITGFRLISPENSIAVSMQREWARLNPKIWKGAGRNRKIKLEAALTVDAVSVFVRSMSAMLRRDKDAFKNSFRRGKLYSFDTPGVPCHVGAGGAQRHVTWEHGPKIMEIMKKRLFHGVTGSVLFDSQGFRRNYNLTVLEMKSSQPLQPTAIWSSTKGFLSLNRSSATDTPRASHPVNDTQTLLITSILSSPYMMLKPAPTDGSSPRAEGNDRFEGYAVDLAEAVAKIVGFTYKIQLVKDGKYGSRDPRGKWNGMVGELINKEADIVIAPLTITSIRERVIDFSKPFMSLGISIMIKRPEKQKPGVFSFMDPLSSEIWGCIIIAYIGVSFVLFVVSRFSPYEWQIEDSVNGPTFTNDFTILNSLWFSLGAFMQQGCDISPRSLSGRIVGSAWWFFTLIIISSYTANLAAFLTVERMLTPIESAEDLAKQTKIAYGTLSSGSTQDFFKTSDLETFETMWRFMNSAKPNVFEKTTQLGVDRVRNSKGKYAFLLESTMNDYHNQRKPCNTMNVGENLDSKGYGIATPLGSELRDSISLAVLKLHEFGDLQNLFKKWWFDKGECQAENNKGSTMSALTLSNVAGIFYILIGGLGLSMVVSLLEFLYKSKMEARRQRNSYNASTARTSKAAEACGAAERENGGYSYSAPSNIVSFDGFSESRSTHSMALPQHTHTHTQV